MILGSSSGKAIDSHSSAVERSIDHRSVKATGRSLHLSRRTCKADATNGFNGAPWQLMVVDRQRIIENGGFSVFVFRDLDEISDLEQWLCLIPLVAWLVESKTILEINWEFSLNGGNGTINYQQYDQQLSIDQNMMGMPFSFGFSWLVWLTPRCDLRGVVHRWAH